jgi:Fur family ferric uptake transcriptional regulator
MNDVTKKLKQQGYRLTKPREGIIAVLKDYPHTVQEIFDELKRTGSKLDLASVYRSMELFERMGIVQAIDLGEGKKRYELIDKDHHHHHLVCNACGIIEDVEVEEESILDEVKIKSKFKIEKHSIEFFGVCVNCQK